MILIPKRFREKGSALVSSLFLALLIAVIATTILRYAATRHAYSVDYGVEVRNFWVAFAGFNSAREDLSLMDAPAANEEKTGTAGPWNFSYRLLDRNGWELEVRTRTGRLDRTISEPLCLRSYAENLLILGKKTRISVPAGSVVAWNGPVLVNAELALDVEGKFTMRSLVPDRPAVECRSFIVRDPASKNAEILLAPSKGDGPSSMSWLVKNGQKTGDVDDPRVSILTSGRDLVSLDKIVGLLSLKPEAVIVDDSTWNRRLRILNPRLLEKDLLAVYTGGREAFKIPEGRGIENLYFGPDPSASRLDPFLTVDSAGYDREYSVLGNELVLQRPMKKLLIGPDDCSILNRFEYARPGRMAAPRSRNLEEIFIDGRKMIEGRDGEIDRENRSIMLYQPDFAKTFGRADGVTKRFPRPPGFGPSSILFSGRNRSLGFRIDGSAIVFDSAPERGTVLSWYSRLPEISAVKGNLTPGTAVFLDKEVDLLEVDLEDLRYPDGTILVFDAPILISGRTSRDLTLVTTSDAYLRDCGAEKGLKVYARLLWDASAGNKPLSLENVFLFSEGSCLYDLSAPASRVSLSGCLVLTCRFGSWSAKLTPDSLVWGTDDLLRLDIKPSGRLGGSRIPFFVLPR